MKVTFPHIQFEKIVDLVESRLSGDELLQAQEHLTACERCTTQLASLNQTVEMMRADTTEDAPRYAIAGALSSFRSRAIAKPSALQRLVAALTFDSLQAAPAMGVRAGARAERQLVFSAGENQVHLQLTPAAGDWVVSGQVLGECEGGTVELSGAPGTVKVALNDLCEFTLPPLAGGSYALVVRLAEVEMEIPELKLGA